MRVSVIVCLLIATILAARATDAPNATSAVLPPGISQAQYDWLSRLGVAMTPDAAASVLMERTDGLDLLKLVSDQEDPTDSDLAKRWLSVNPGILVLAEHAPEPRWQAEGLYWVGLVDRRNGRLDEALPLYERARDLFQRAGNAEGVSMCWWRIAGVHQKRGETETALSAYEHASRISESSEDPELIENTFLSWGDSLEEAKHYTEEVAVLERAKSLLADHKRKDLIGVIDGRLGHVQRLLGNSEEAIRLCREGLSELDQGVRHAWEALPIFDTLCAEEMKEGRMDAALQDLMRELDLARTVASDAEVVWVCSQIADLFSETGHNTEALVYLDKALSIAKSSGTNRGLVAACLSTIARHLEDAGDYQGAHARFEESLRISEAIQDHAGMEFCNRFLADVETYTGHPERALVYLNRARTVLESSPDLKDSPRYHSRDWTERLFQTMALIALGRYREALPIAERCRTESEDDPSALIAALVQEGETYEGLGEPERVIPIYRRLMLLEAENPPQDPGWVNTRRHPDYQNLTHLLIANKDFAGAFAVAQQAKGNAVRGFLLSGRAPVTPLSPEDADRLHTLQQSYQSALQHCADRPDDASAAKVRDGALTELTTFEITLRAHYPLWSAAQAHPVSIDEVAKDLDASSALLEVMLDPKHVSLLLLRNVHGRAVLTGHVSDIAPKTLASWTSRAADALRNPRSDARTTHQLMRRLYDIVIRPVEKDLSGVHTLTVCPDRYLHALPFAALEDASGRYLIQKVALTVAPSASAWDACRTVAASHQLAGPSTPMLAAVSRFGTKVKVASALVPKRALRGNEVADLPGVVGEANVVEQAYRGRIVKLLEKDATAEAVQEAAKRASVLHLATHAFANDAAPMLGSLLFSPSPENPSGLLYARDVLRIPIQADLAVLSACETDEGPGTGEGLLGLAWAFMVAGCPSTIGSRWDVDDQAAQRWMAAFYGSYTSGSATIAESHRRACLALLATKGMRDDYSAPRFWANWTLIGSDR